MIVLLSTDINLQRITLLGLTTENDDTIIVSIVKEVNACLSRKEEKNFSILNKKVDKGIILFYICNIDLRIGVVH